MNTLKSIGCAILKIFGHPCTQPPMPSALPRQRGVVCVFGGAGGVQPGMLQTLRDTFGPNCNSVRLYLHLKNVAAAAKITLAGAEQLAYAWADAMLDEASKLGMNCWIHRRYFYMPDGTLIDRTSPDFWNNVNGQFDQALSQVTAMATHFHAHGAELAGYDIISEPVAIVNGVDQVPPGYLARQIQILDALDSGDAALTSKNGTRYAIAKFAPWAGAVGYAGQQPVPGFPRLVYGVHFYQPRPSVYAGVEKPYGFPGPGWPCTIGTTAWNAAELQKVLQPALDFGSTYGVRMSLSEFSYARWSAGGEQWLSDLIGIVEAAGWDWNYFMVGAAPGVVAQCWAAEYDASFTPAAFGLPGEVGIGASPRGKALASIFQAIK
ncbi:MAG: hypothetical protein ACRES7_00230 [Gammaproteobacteria bacterium]